MALPTVDFLAPSEEHPNYSRKSIGQAPRLGVLVGWLVGVFVAVGVDGG